MLKPPPGKEKGKQYTYKVRVRKAATRNTYHLQWYFYLLAYCLTLRGFNPPYRGEGKGFILQRFGSVKGLRSSIHSGLWAHTPPWGEGARNRVLHFFSTRIPALKPPTTTQYAPQQPASTTRQRGTAHSLPYCRLA